MKRLFTILTILNITIPLLSFSQTSLPLSRTVWNSTPADWTDNGTGSYTSTYACSGNNGGRLDSSGDFYEVFFSDTPDQLDYTLKISGSSASSLLVEEFDGGTWTTIVNHTVLPTVCTNYNHTLSATTTKVRWSYSKTAGNLTMDDVSITKAVATGPSVAFDNGTSAATEADTDFNVDIPVTVSNYGGVQVDINLTVTGGTAEPGDYTLNTNNLSFTADGTLNVSLTIHDDADLDNETVEITITETGGAGASITTAVHTLTITDNDLPSEINLQSSTGVNIMNGDATPSTAEGTDFGIVELGMSSTSTITIQNTGGADLTAGTISISGTDMADFGITNYTAGTVVPGAGSTIFDIVFTPGSIGVKNATISIVNDDSDENPYTFDITGEGFSLEEIAITEFMVAPNNPGVEFVEIHNYGATSVDLMDWRLKDEDADNNVISATSLIIEAGEYLILVANKTGFETAWFNGNTCDQVIDVLGSFALANGGDEIILVNGDGDTVWSLAYANDDEAGIAAHYTEATFANRFWGSKASQGVNTDGNDVTGTLGYERNNATADALVFTAANADMGSPLNQTACYENEIDIQGGASLTSIMSGDATPEAADGTEVIAIIGTAGMQTFTIENQGFVEDLTITGITSDNGAFTISGATFPLVVSVGMTATFTVGYTSSMIGTAMATITVANDDSDEGTYTFGVAGISPGLTAGDGCTAAVATAVDGSGTMVHFLDASNGLIASVSSTGTDFSATGDEISIFTNLGSPTSSTAVDGNPYLIMGRQFNIESVVAAPYTGLTVRLYFNNSDYSDLSNVSCPTCPALTTPDDIEVSHYDGTNQNCDQSDNDFMTTPSENLGGVYGTYGSDAFYIEVNPTHFSEFFGHQTNNIVFPVELTDFLARKSGQDNILNWQTATETNNESFVIERRDNTSGWEKIGNVDGAGDSTDPVNYSFTDKNVTGTQYYRLKQIDFDGTFAYSDMVGVVRKKSSDTVSEFYPNPSHTGSVHVDYEAGKNEELVISGFDAGGKLVFREVRNVTNGPNRLVFDFKGLDRGLYIMELQSENQQVQRKLILD